MTTGLAILIIVTAISLITASSGSGLVTSAFAVKKGSGKSGTSTDSKSSPSTTKSGTSNAGSTSTGTKRAFIKCVTAIAGSPTKAEVDHCWDQVFGGGSGSSSTLGGGSTTSGRASSGPSGGVSPSTSGSST